jgi:hypothetical protein
MNKATVSKRTFEAKKHPKDSAERSRLNANVLTSEYMPSYKYCIVDENGKGISTTARPTKQECEALLNNH